MNAILPTNTLQHNTQLDEPDTRVEARELDQEQLPISGKKAEISTTFGINLCASPGSDAEWVGLLGPKTVVSLLQHQKQEDGSIWYYVEAGVQRGWVSSSCLKVIG